MGDSAVENNGGCEDVEYLSFDFALLNEEKQRIKLLNRARE